jgi:hypothetical protein
VCTITAKIIGQNRLERTVHFRLPSVEDSLVEATGAGVKFRVKKGKDRINVPLVLARVPQLEQGVKIVSEESDFSSGAVYEGS